MQGPLCMQDLYSFSQVIKSLPFYTLHRDLIHGLFRQLGENENLNCEGLLMAFDEQQPEWSHCLRGHVELYKKYEAETQRLRDKGYRFVVYGEVMFPKNCYLMSDPPLSLSFLGEPVWLRGAALSVVGSREPSEISVTWMEKEFAHFCEENQVCIVSGGARGVDQKAHSLSLRKNNPTIIVLPSGLLQIYPSSLQEWIKPVLQSGGCFVSEYAPEQRMHKYLFHHRNRLIAALGGATLLIEARRRSGTLITAQQSLQLGRAVGVVPGHPLDPHFGGSLDLLSEGAFLVRDAQDLAMFFQLEKPAQDTDGLLLVGATKGIH